MEKLLALLGVKSEDEAEKVIMAFTRTMNALSESTGTQDPSQIVGVIHAWKSSVDREKTLSAELEGIKAAKVRAEATSLIDSLVADGRLEPSKRDTMEALYTGHGLVALQAAAGALPAAKAVKTEEPKTPAPNAAGLTKEGLSEDEIKLCKDLGKSVDVYLADKSKLEAAGPIIEFRTA